MGIALFRSSRSVSQGVTVADKKSKAGAKTSAKGDRSGGAESTPEEHTGKAVPHVWDVPDGELDPPSQRPADTHEEELGRRKAG
jgi:hypothetical protein